MISLPEGEEEVASVALPTHPPGKDLSLPRDLPGREREIIPLGLLNALKIPLELNAMEATVKARGFTALASSPPQSPGLQNTRCSQGLLLILTSL